MMPENASVSLNSTTKVSTTSATVMPSRKNKSRKAPTTVVHTRSKDDFPLCSRSAFADVSGSVAISVVAMPITTRTAMAM